MKTGVMTGAAKIDKGAFIGKGYMREVSTKGIVEGEGLQFCLLAGGKKESAK